MGAHRIVEVMSRLGRAFWRWLWPRLRRPINWPAALLLLYGVPGHLDDGATWFKWLTAGVTTVVNYVPYIPDVAVADVASFLKSDLVRTGAVLLALVLIFAGEKLSKGTKAAAHGLRRGTRYLMAEITGSPRRINRADALSIVRNSRWTRSRYEKSRKPRSFWNEIGFTG